MGGYGGGLPTREFDNSRKAQVGAFLAQAYLFLIGIGVIVIPIWFLSSLDNEPIAMAESHVGQAIILEYASREGYSYLPDSLEGSVSFWGLWGGPQTTRAENASGIQREWCVNLEYLIYDETSSDYLDGSAIIYVAKSEPEWLFETIKVGELTPDTEPDFARALVECKSR